MSDQIIDLHTWLQAPPGRYLLDWEQRCYEQAVVDIFGYHGVQLGLPMLDTLAANRMAHHWMVLEQCGGQELQRPPALLADFTALPFASASLDLVTLPHTLELSSDPHACLREVERVLVPEGRVVLSGFNPLSLWGLAQRRTRLYRRLRPGQRLYLPESVELLGFGRLRDWLRLLGLELEQLHFGGYRWAVRSQKNLDRLAWMEPLGARWWPILGAAYCMVAVKRVRGMRLISPAWEQLSVRSGARMPVAQCHKPDTLLPRTPRSL